MDPCQRLFAIWKTIETLVAKTCRNRGLSVTDAEIVSTLVTLKLFEDDCAVVRRYAGRHDAKFTTYIGSIVLNTFSDFCTKRLGKWHASAAATRLGPVALALERLVYREQCPPDEAIARLQTSHPGVTRAELADMLGALRVRLGRPSTVSLDAMTTEIASGTPADFLIVEEERRQLAERTARVVTRFLEKQEHNDRALLQYLFEANMEIATIARILRVPQKRLYRRRDQLLKGLRKEMMNAGITRDDVRELFGHIPDGLNFGLQKEEKCPTEKTKTDPEGVAAHPEIPR